MMWKSVVGWEGLYEVSDTGRVRSNARTSIRSNGTVQSWPAREMKCYPNSSGYLIVRLSKPGTRGLARVHRLVAEAFLPSAHTTETVNHKDGVKTNNEIGNLEWATRSENTRHAIANGLGDYVPPWRKPKLPAAPKGD